jgi:predicted O-methyltransferase YrrM
MKPENVQDRFHDLPALFKERGLKVGAEIGVAGGFYSKWLFYGIPGLKLYLIDPWKSYDGYVEHHNPEDQSIMDDCLAHAHRRLDGKNCEFIRKTSMEAVKDFEDESLDFVFIDGNHSFEYVIEDIAQWSKKVRKGGIVSGHDYWNSVDRGAEPKLCQVKDAVDAWTKTNNISWYIARKDKSPSWFWIKQ